MKSEIRSDGAKFAKGSYTGGSQLLFLINNNAGSLFLRADVCLKSASNIVMSNINSKKVNTNND